VLYWHQVRISNRRRDNGPKYIGVMTLTFLGHVTSSVVTIRIPMGHFLLVVHWTQVSISIRFQDIWH